MPTIITYTICNEKIEEKFQIKEIARIFHGILREDEQDVTSDSSKGTRGHCQIGKTRGLGDENDVTDCSGSLKRA